MSQLFNFLREKIDPRNLHFHYLRIGNTEAIFDKLKNITEDVEKVEWTLHEADSFAKYHFGKLYTEYDAAIINININEDNAQEFRKDFWENFIYKTEDMPLPFALIIPNSNKFSSLTSSQIYEILSLIRLTDRPFKLFEYGENIAVEIVEWLNKIASIVHKKEHELESADNSNE